MFRSLRVFNYRLWFVGATISSIGVWMQITAQNWLVLTVLTDNDANALGITVALQYGPALLLVTVTGWASDRFDRRHLLLLTQGLMMLLAIILGVLVLQGMADLWSVYVLSAGLGVVSAFDAPSRHAFVAEIVDREYLANAVALNASTYNAARLVGPVIAGFTIVAIGIGWVFVANALTFLALIFAILVMRRHELLPDGRTPRAQRMSEGLTYIIGRSKLLVVFAFVFFIAAFALNLPVFAATMAVEFGLDATGLGLLTAALAVGSIAGALLAAARPHASVALMVTTGGVFGISSIAAAVMPSYGLFAVMLAGAGLASTASISTANGVVQGATAPALRGRVLALYLAVVLGGTPIGGLIIGWMTSELGPRPAIVVAGLVALLAFAFGSVWLVFHRPDPSSES